jgi:hypothetical protein
MGEQEAQVVMNPQGAPFIRALFWRVAHSPGEQEAQIKKNPEGAPFIRALFANEWEDRTLPGFDPGKTLDKLPFVRYMYVY